MSAAAAWSGPPPQRTAAYRAAGPPHHHHHHHRPPPSPSSSSLSSSPASKSPQQRQRRRAAETTTTSQQSAQRVTTKEWEGLADWRRRGVDPRRAWGTEGTRGSPTTQPRSSSPAEILLPPLAPSLVETAAQVLRTPEPELKAVLFHRAWLAYNDRSLPLFPPSWEQQQGGAGGEALPPPPPPELLPLDLPARPARPAKPALVATPKEVPSADEAGVPPNAHLLLGVAHVELNAIDLAADTIARFAPLRLPALFYEDHARVADDEGRHLSWCLQRLAELGLSYGDVPAAHDGLWRGCAASGGDLASRLVVVPMAQEARGLDAGERLASRLVGLGDARSAAIVARIAEEERAHVAIGVAWFERVCGAFVAAAGSREIDRGAEFRARLRACGCVDLATKRSSFNHGERARVGLLREWYDVTAWGEEGGGAQEESGGLALPPLNEGTPRELMAELRVRLADMVELEAGAAAEADGG